MKKGKINYKKRRSVWFSEEKKKRFFIFVGNTIDAKVRFLHSQVQATLLTLYLYQQVPRDTLFLANRGKWKIRKNEVVHTLQGALFLAVNITLN